MSRAGKSEDLAGTRQRRPRYLPDPKSIPLFRCSSCFALYQVTIAEASPATADLKIECRVCNAPRAERTVRPEISSPAESEPRGRTAGAAWFSSGKPHRQEAVDEKATTVRPGQFRRPDLFTENESIGPGCSGRVGCQLINKAACPNSVLAARAALSAPLQWGPPQ
jgi:hypothetical protein